jgi:radical SAM superfamily enzyme YgiQ (UPF0313 family)
MAHGIHCVGLDLNIEVYNKIKHHPQRQMFLDFFYKQKIHEPIVDDLVRILDFYAREILYHTPTIVGLSIFSAGSKIFTAWLGAMIRTRAPNVKIIIGGPGMQTLENSLFKFPDRLRQLGLIDDYIVGDGEIALVEYVKGNLTYPGINSTNWQQIKDFDQMPIPDFSDYKFLNYRYVLLPIVDSRGCVQDCEFCDVIAFWTKFQYRTADNIFRQMMQYIDQYKVYRFQFASSICNGNFREFKKLLGLIANHNRTSYVTEQIHWVGSFIIRPAQQHNEELWSLIKETNGFLFCGVESLVEHVRIGLGKRFTNADLEHHLVMGQKHQVPMNLLLISSYPTETFDDYEYSKQWFRDHTQFANNTVQQVQLTLPSVFPGTRLEKHTDRQEFESKELVRSFHFQEMQTVIKDSGFNVQCFV